MGKLFSVNEMVRKDSVRARLEGREQGLSFTEFSYMLLQAWDFLQLYDRYGCELQLGGSDQWGNITEGIDLIRRRRDAQAFGLTSPLVTKADGTKFGKTEVGQRVAGPGPDQPVRVLPVLAPDRATPRSGAYLRRFTFLDPGAHRGTRRGHRRPPRAAPGPAGPGASRSRPWCTARTRPAGPSRPPPSCSRPRSPSLDRGHPGDGARRRPDARSSRRPSRGASSAWSTPCSAPSLAASRGTARQLLAQGAIYINGARVAEDRPLGAEDVLHGRWVVLRRGRGNQGVLAWATAEPGSSAR